MIDIIRNPRTYTNPAQITDAVCKAAAMLKLVTGICNNATFLVMADAMDQLEAHPRYRGKVKRLFTDAIKEWKRYEGNLLYAERNRFFNINDLAPSVRAKFKDISNREYFEFWQGTGGRAFMKTHGLITSLANKFKMSFERDGYQYADILQWPMTAAVCLHMCVKMYDTTIDTASDAVSLPKEMLHRIFAPLCVTRPKQAWDFALRTLEPSIKGDVCAGERNIELGIVQLYDAWSSSDATFGSTAEAISDFAEVFAGKKTVKQIKTQLYDMKHDVDAQELEQRKKKILEGK